MLTLSVVLTIVGLLAFIAGWWMEEPRRSNRIRELSGYVGIPGIILAVLAAILLVCSYGIYLTNRDGVGKWMAFYRETVTRYQYDERVSEILIDSAFGDTIAIKEVASAIDFLDNVVKYNKILGSLRGYESTPLVGQLIPDTSHLKYIVVGEMPRSCCRSCIGGELFHISNNWRSGCKIIMIEE